MTTTINVKVSGRYRAIVVHGNRPAVVINGEEDHSFILSDHPMQEVFVITEESAEAAWGGTVGLHEDPNVAPRPTPEQIAADTRERTREQETLAQRDAKVKAQEAEEDRKDKEAVRKAAAETAKAAQHTVKAAAARPSQPQPKPSSSPTTKK